MSRRSPSPLGTIARGLAAGAVGTAAMTAWQKLSARVRSSDAEASVDPAQDPWELASAPAKVARRIGEGVFHRKVSSDLIPVLTHVMHWAYGTGWGAVYGIVAGSRPEPPGVAGGALFGTGVWALSYAELVPMGLYQPPWEYPPGELALDLSHHLVYGAVVGAAFAPLARAGS